MLRPATHRILTLALALLFCLPALAVTSAYAAPWRQGTPPAGLDASHPTVSGLLVAKPITGGGPIAPVVCQERDRTPDAQRLLVNRGLVICTDEGELVLLQLSQKTGLYDRNWHTLGIAGMSLGDRLNAWGVLHTGGTLLDPTFAVQDYSKPRTQYQLVAGTLVAKPISGEGPTGPVVCRNQDRTLDVQRLMVNRGLVICTEDGRLILLQLASTSRLWTRDKAGAMVLDLTIGDHLTALGTLKGSVLDPTISVTDTNIQAKLTASQDFIANGGKMLTLFVLQSGGGSPVQGQVQAEQRDTARVVLCGGKIGNWSDLHQGQTVNINGSVYNLRLRAYIDTDYVKVMNCS